MNKGKAISRRLLAILMAIAVTLSMAPALSLISQQPVETGAVTAVTANAATFLDYNEASYDKSSNRIGQGGTSNIRQYFFHGAEVERENDGQLDAKHVYANNYGYQYDIRTDKDQKDYWDNYIQNKLDASKPILFGFFLSGPQTAKGTDQAAVSTLDCASVQTEDGTVVLSGADQLADTESEFTDGKCWKNANMGGTGGGGGSGPARGFDLFMRIPKGTLQPNTEYVLDFKKGMGARTKSDKEIKFHFTTASTLVTGIHLTPSSAELKPGQTTTLTASVEPEDANEKGVVWSSSDSKIATVNKRGIVTAVAPGNAVITAAAKDGSGISASASIKVNIPDPEQLLMLKAVKSSRTSTGLTWNKIDGADGYVVYAARCNTGSMIHSFKKVKTVKNGEATAWTKKKLKNGKSYKYKVEAYRTVNNGKKKKVIAASQVAHSIAGGYSKKYTDPVSIKPAAKTLTLQAGQSGKVKAGLTKRKKGRYYLPKDHVSRVRFASNNETVASVGRTGKVRAHYPGRCTIYMQAPNGLWTTVSVTVK
ncbi:MAG: Ig-like domain-containing protein [Anaerovoracaceae bacterium]|jgi:uncharacterized protein YjdB